MSFFFPSPFFSPCLFGGKKGISERLRGPCCRLGLNQERAPSRRRGKQANNGLRAPSRAQPRQNGLPGLWSPASGNHTKEQGGAGTQLWSGFPSFFSACCLLSRACGSSAIKSLMHVRYTLQAKHYSLTNLIKLLMQWALAQVQKDK